MALPSNVHFPTLLPNFLHPVLVAQLEPLVQAVQLVLQAQQALEVQQELLVPLVLVVPLAQQAHSELAVQLVLVSQAQLAMQSLVNQA